MVVIMAPPQKSSKIARKGAKQIVDENAETLIFYRNLAITASTLSLIVLYFYISTISIVLNFLSCVIYIGSYQFMTYMAKPQYTETGRIQDSGVDLNMEGGIAEHIKDVIIVTAACQILSALVSNYFWYLWLFIPMRAIWLLWTNVLSPYFFQAAPAESEISEKAQRKMDRRMKRMQ